MQFFTTIQILALLTTSALAGTISPNARNALMERGGCEGNMPLCANSKYVGTTKCRCEGQKGTCEAWYCGENVNDGINIMSCGGENTGCAWL
ncbi:hypothetical protein GLAREA_11358 [Glarea lozoyensis ATCC 20868]|uniref:Uncharacterized protein n=1 Tax=Glarea lozoyensis (strain ATCC 20868 / MF5171) TaxID=1116229 RepID=S3EBH2_GLAL2|nr:uncharacterized protein GLAREA_11358 [Glarea lozoyensis ATCC 20868]EPE35658.1 hypothetical protein GLAREA_11358 [Glarea lozoyensis ATCC 20868]